MVLIKTWDIFSILKKVVAVYLYLHKIELRFLFVQKKCRALHLEQSGSKNAEGHNETESTENEQIKNLYVLCVVNCSCGTYL